MIIKRRSYWTVAAVGAVATTALTVSGLVGGGHASAAGQSYVVSCPAADQVTPDLNANLISNPGAEDSTAATSVGAPAGDNVSLPDCWTSTSPLPAPDATLSVESYSALGGIADPSGGSALFWGGDNYSGSTSTTDTASQTIKVRSLHPGGRRFELTGWLGGVTTGTADASVAVTFEDASGNSLASASIGPVTEAQRSGETALSYRAWYGKVPQKTTTAVVTITASGSGVTADGLADDLNLSIGPDAIPSTPILQTLTYTYPAGSGGSLYRPQGVSAADGTVNVSNTGDDVVSAIDRYGNTTAIAGELEGNGDHGNGGLATSATLARPAGTAVDRNGDIFIADAEDNVVREITPNGRIYRVAGDGIAGAALGRHALTTQLDRPEAVAVNPAGDLFIADTYNNRVLEVLPGGAIRVAAGSGRAGYNGDGGRAALAELNQPTGIAFDSVGDLYIADSANSVIRRVDVKTGRISTVAGDYAADRSNDGVGGYSGDGGPATLARLDDPQGVAVDGAGDLFIADTFNNAIRKVTPAGIISTIVNSSAPTPGAETSGVAPTFSELNAPYAVAVDPSTDTLYIADTTNSKVAEVLDVAKPGSAPGPVAPTSQR